MSGLLETFDGGLGNYAPIANTPPASVTFQGGAGNPLAGCAYLVSETGAGVGDYFPAAIENSTDTYVLVENAPSLWFNSVHACNVNLGFTPLSFAVDIIFSSGAPIHTTYLGFALVGTSPPYTLGWAQRQIALPGRVIGDTITSITFTCMQSLGAGSPQNIFTALVDSISVSVATPSFDANPAPLSLYARSLSVSGTTLNNDNNSILIASDMNVFEFIASPGVTVMEDIT